MDFSLQILLITALLIFLAKGAGDLVGRIGLPLVLGELLAGVILGPTVFNIWRFPWFSSSAAAGGLSLPSVIKVLADIGVVILMFLAGVETDVGLMRAAVGPAFWAACGGVALPFVGGFYVSRAGGLDWREAAIVGCILTATSVSVTAQTLMNLNRLRSKVGSTILGAAVIDDVLGLMALSLVIASVGHGGKAASAGPVGVWETLARMVLFFLVAFWLGPRFIRRVLKHLRPNPGSHAAVALCIALVFAFLAQYVGRMAAITGSYLAGLFVAASPARNELLNDVRSMTNSFFGPLFFVSIGLETNARTLGRGLGFFLVIFLVASLGKVIGCGLGAWFQGLKPRDSLVVGVGMIPRGEVGLITASVGWASGLVSAEVYAMAVALVLATTLVTPVLLRFCFPPDLAVATSEIPSLTSEPPQNF